MCAKTAAVGGRARTCTRPLHDVGHDVCIAILHRGEIDGQGGMGSICALLASQLVQRRPRLRLTRLLCQQRICKP